jgi:hypothetical protein
MWSYANPDLIGLTFPSVGPLPVLELGVLLLLVFMVVCAGEEGDNDDNGAGEE